MKENMFSADTLILLISDIVSYSRRRTLINFYRHILRRNLEDIQPCGVMAHYCVGTLSSSCLLLLMNIYEYE
jgi:hypothetical protein